MPRSSPLRRLLRYTSPHRRTVWLATTCSVVNKVFDLAPPVLIGAAVDVVVKREDSLLAGLGFPDVTQQLWILGGLTVLIWALESAFEYAYAWLWRNLAQTVQHELRLDVYSHVQKLDAGWFAERSTGGTMAVLNDDVNQLERFLDGGANDLLQVATTVVVVSAVFFAASPGVAALALLPMPFVLWGSFAFQRRIAPRYATVRARVGSLSAQLHDNLGGIETIKSFTAEAHEVERIRAASDAYREANGEAIRLSAAFTPLIRMVIVVGFTATLLVGGQQALDGTMAVGTYSVLVFLTQRLLWPLTRLGATVDLYQRAMASTERALDLLDTPVVVADGLSELGEVDGSVRFEAVRFGYPGRELIFDGFDLDLPAGRTIAVVGATGAGKTSLVRLLLRFHDVAGGAVRLDGHDTRDLRLADLRGAIGLVSQSVFLFPGSVRDNIAYGRLGATDDEIEAAARAAEAHPFIAALPEGYETPIGERGQKLSGGQAQRLSIARALLKDPPILVLDEATSAVDNETEAAIQRSLARFGHTRGDGRPRTTLVIAHRLSTIRHADEIVVLDRGEVVERGPHEVLLARSGPYARLWEIQTGEAAGAA